MSQSPIGSDELPNSSTEIRDTILKSGFCGVAATVLAVAIWSPAGLGGMIGTSVASSLGFGAQPGADENTMSFAAIPSPLTAAELQSIHERLSSSDAQLANVRAATDSEIALMRQIASTDGLVAYTMASTEGDSGNTPVAAAHIDPHMELAELLLPKDPG